MIRRRLVQIAGVGLLGVAVYAGALVATTPSLDHLRTTAPTQTSYMRLRGAERTGWVDLDGVSPYLVCAVIKAEDRGFFRHAGLEWGQLRKAAWGYLTGDARTGGSTITQQLARNLYLTPARSLHRKLREALIARRLERTLDKRRILELYLNLIEWGDGVWGAQQAARAYLGRAPRDLGAFEAAVLASLLPAPRAALTGRNQRRAIAEQRRVLHQLAVAGVIDRATYTDAQARVARLDAELTRGLSLRAALASVAPPTTPPPVLARLLADECGLARELAVTERARLATRAAARTP